MIYLYAIIEPRRELPDLTGLRDQPLQVLASGEVAGVYSEHEALQREAEPELLWCHDQVVEQLMRGGPVLPVRFGTVLPDTPALASLLEQRGQSLRVQLERVRGCVELAVRVGLPSVEPAAATDGREYLDQRLARRRAHDAAARRTLEPLAAVATATNMRLRGPSEHILTGSYLVRRDGVGRFTQELRRLQRHNPELSLSCTGPWAPYSFVDAESGA